MPPVAQGGVKQHHQLPRAVQIASQGLGFSGKYIGRRAGNQHNCGVVGNIIHLGEHQWLDDVIVPA